ncbi:MAG: hypothetical protein ACK2T7_11315 [Anaerolineales bacterium]
MRYRRWRRQVRERIVLAIILGLFVLNFCLCFGLGLVTTVLQQIGILPTPTPTPIEVETQVQGSAQPPASSINPRFQNSVVSAKTL